MEWVDFVFYLLFPGHAVKMTDTNYHVQKEENLVCILVITNNSFTVLKSVLKSVSSIIPTVSEKVFHLKIFYLVRFFRGRWG